MRYGDIEFISTPKGPSIFREFASPKNVTQLELWEQKLGVSHVDEQPVMTHTFEADLTDYTAGKPIGIIPIKNVISLHFSEPEEWLNTSIEPRLECTGNWEEFREHVAQKIANMFRIPPSFSGSK